MKSILQILKPLVILAIFAGAVYLLYRQFKNVSYDELKESVAAISFGQLVAALVLVALNYICLMGYDFLAIRYIGHRLPPGKLAMASFIGHVSSFNFGSLLGGSAMRYRFYSIWGFSAFEVVQLIAILGVTFWLGVMFLAAVVFLIDPFEIPAGINALMPDWAQLHNVRPLGVVLLVIVLAYLAICAVRRRPLKLLGWELVLPAPSLSIGQILVSSAELVLAGAALYALMPADLGAPYLRVLGVYLLGLVVAAFAHVPGGLAVLELAVVGCLAVSDSDARQLAGPVIVFRAMYYLLPLVVASVLVAIHEALHNRHFFARVGKWLEGALPGVAPRLASLVVFAGGAFLVISGALPVYHHRLSWFGAPLPRIVIEGAHLCSSLIGVVLLVLAYALQQRLRGAFRLSLAMLGLGIVVALLKGFDYESAIVLCVLLGMLLPAGGFFYRRGAALRVPLSTGWATAAVLVLLCALWFGLLMHHRLAEADFGDVGFWSQIWREERQWSFVRAMVGSVGLLVVLGLAALLRPAAPRGQPLDDARRQLARRVLAAAPAAPPAAVVRATHLLAGDGPDAALFYAVGERSWIALGDPVGPAAEQTELVWRFREMVEAHYGWPVFYHVGDQNAPTYLDLGLTLLALGEEARVELSAFSLDGHDGKPLRQLQHRLQRLGCAAEVLAPEAAALVLPELHRVSAAWTARRGHQAEPGDGSPDEATWIAGPVALVRQQQRVVAFARLIGGGRHELAAAVVRHLPDAPDQALDYLLVESMLWAQREGYAWFNLGTVPAEDYPDRRLRPVASRTGAAWFCQGEQFHGLRGLRQHHERFAPVWRPCYLAVPGGLALPRILDDVARLVLCGADGDLHPSATDGAGGKGEG